jgi:hypothetical protein
MFIVVLLSVSASLGLAIGLLVLPVSAIIFSSLTIASLSFTILLDDGFSVYSSGFISVASLTALQISYLVGVGSLSWNARYAPGAG